MIYPLMRDHVILNFYGPGDHPVLGGVFYFQNIEDTRLETLSGPDHIMHLCIFFVKYVTSDTLNRNYQKGVNCSIKLIFIF